MKNEYLELAIYSFKKAISEYNNLFEPERLNQFCTNILQAFNRIFIFYCIEKGLEYKTSKGKIKSLEDLMKPLKTNGKMTDNDSFVLKTLKEIRNNFQHDKYDSTNINNAFIFVSILVSLFKKIIKKIL